MTIVQTAPHRLRAMAIGVPASCALALIFVATGWCFRPQLLSAG